MTLPNPLVPANADLRNFEYMPLDVVRLRDSDFAVLSSAEAFRAGILLWCAAWHQVPAGSLPNDARVLANLAGFGRVVKEWEKVKDEALHGWILCSDNRFYHPVVCEKVLESVTAKVKHQYEKFSDRMRKANIKLSNNGQPTIAIPDFETWKLAGFLSEWSDNSNGKQNNSVGIPAENALKGTEGNGTDIKALPPLREDDSKLVDNLPPLPPYTPPVDEGRRIAWVDMGISQLPEDWRFDVLKDWPQLHPDDFKAKWISFTAHFADKSGDLKTREAWFQRWKSWMAQDAAKLIADRTRRDNYQSGGKSENSDTRISRAEIEKKAHRGETYEEAEARLIREKRNKERSV